MTPNSTYRQLVIHKVIRDLAAMEGNSLNREALMNALLGMKALEELQRYEAMVASAREMEGHWDVATNDRDADRGATGTLARQTP